MTNTARTACGSISFSLSADASRLQVALDRNDVRDLAGQLQQIVYDECPYLILGYHSDIQAIREDVWTGYDEVLSAAGGLFCNGSADAYMTLTPAGAGD